MDTTKNDWVKNALGETIVWIAEGALLMKLNKATREALWALYEDDYEKQWKAKANWEVDRERIKPLARLVGGFAAVATVSAWIDSGVLGLPPVEVDQDKAVASAHFVAKFRCAGPIITPLGRYCRGLADATSGTLEQVVADLMLS